MTHLLKIATAKEQSEAISNYTSFSTFSKDDQAAAL
jgi:hypothetical protein